MSRYFIEVAYKGTNYAGFQKQQNANSIQAEIEKVLQIFFKDKFLLTCSSRTDAGVHALSNYFHFDSDSDINLLKPDKLQNSIYNLNAILPDDIVVKRLFAVEPTAHSRFDAKSRIYKYYIYQHKDPFLNDRAYYYPYSLDIDKLQSAADILLTNNDFSSFSKKHTQVKSFICTIKQASWTAETDTIVFTVEGNRFLRGMVRGLVGTMLQVGRGKITINEFQKIIENSDATKADFSVPAHALFLFMVNYEME